MPHTIVSAECCTQLWAQNAAHYCERRMPLNFLSCRAGNGIILTLLQTLHNFSLSSVTPRAVNIYLQHVECVFEFKWLCFTVTNSISHDPSSICCTTQRQVLQQHQLHRRGESFWFLAALAALYLPLSVSQSVSSSVRHDQTITSFLSYNLFLPLNCDITSSFVIRP